MTDIAAQTAARLDDWGKPAWITVVILGFILFWPVGLAILVYLIWSGRIMARWTEGGWGRWSCSRAEGKGRWGRRTRPSSGNHAFDEYRDETLRRLEDEQKEFQDFLDQLRQAKDKAEFDQFMAGRRRRRTAEPPPEAPEDAAPA